VRLHCPFEQDLLDAVAARRWPERADGELRGHVDSCASCADAAEIAAAFLDARHLSVTDAVVPPASSVWWRSQIRARHESARLAARPIVIVQALATVVVAAVALAAAPAAYAAARELIAVVASSGWLSARGDVSWSWVLGATAYTAVPLLAAGIWIVLAPVLVFLALDD
jgi:hypothetical protein